MIMNIWNKYKPILLIFLIIVLGMFFLASGLYIVFTELTADVAWGLFLVSFTIGLGSLLVADRLIPSAILTIAAGETFTKSASQLEVVENNGVSETTMTGNEAKHEIKIQYAGVRMYLEDQKIPLQVRLFFPRKGRYDIYIRVDDHDWIKIADIDIDDEIPRIDVPIKRA